LIQRYEHPDRMGLSSAQVSIEAVVEYRDQRNSSRDKTIHFSCSLNLPRAVREYALMCVVLVSVE